MTLRRILLTDPWFYVVCIPAVILYGIAKGGFGNVIGVLAVPMMALVMPPMQAAGILLPVLLVMDVLAVRAYWGLFDRRALQILLPGAMLGLVIGYFTATFMNEHYLRILVGVVSLVFGLQSLVGLRSRASSEHYPVVGGLFGALSGFTSFSIHAGGPPFTMYLIPKNLSPMLFAGTAALFFAVVNVVKLVPYSLLGQFTTENLIYSLVLVPFAPIGVMIGHYLVQRSASSFYYSVISAFLVVVGIGLLWEAWVGLHS